jgi:phage recombination protein Bet
LGALVWTPYALGQPEHRHLSSGYSHQQVIITMSSQITTTTAKPSALATMASKFNVDPSKLLGTLKNTVFKGASDDELMSLVIVANEYGLNPLTKEIYAFPAKGGGIVPVVSIDGWLRMMNDHPQFDGIEFEFCETDGKLISCTAMIYRKDRKHPTSVTEYLSECRRGTDPWKMEHRMLRHKATIQCARVAFGFSGITDEDEAERIGSARDVTPKATESKLFKPKTPAPEECPQPPPFKSLAQSPATADSPATYGDGRQDQSNESAESFSLDATEVSLLDQVAEKLSTARLKWSEVHAVMADNGLADADFVPLTEAPSDVLSACLAQFDAIVKLVKGGVK